MRLLWSFICQKTKTLLYDIAWCCAVLYGITWYFMIYFDISWSIDTIEVILSACYILRRLDCKSFRKKANKDIRCKVLGVRL